MKNIKVYLFCKFKINKEERYSRVNYQIPVTQLKGQREMEICKQQTKGNKDMQAAKKD